MTVNGNETISKVTPISARREGKHARRNFLRTLVEQELQARRGSSSKTEDDMASTTEPMEGVVWTLQQDDRTSWKDFSEEELLVFLQELEQDEIVDQESRFAALVEEMERSIELEEQYLIDQLFEYEQWQSSGSAVVFCPMCHQGKLLENEATDLIVCSNTMDGSCSFRLYTELSLYELSERLRLVYEEHGSVCRELPQVFQMDDDSLAAVCLKCGTNRSIVGE